MTPTLPNSVTEMVDAVLASIGPGSSNLRYCRTNPCLDHWKNFRATVFCALREIYGTELFPQTRQPCRVLTTIICERILVMKVDNAVEYLDMLRREYPAWAKDDLMLASHVASNNPLAYIAILNEFRKHPESFNRKPPVPEEAPIHEENTMTAPALDTTRPAITNQTLIYGVLAENVSDEQIFKAIQDLEAQIRNLETISAESKAVQKHIAKMKKDIKKLVEIVDAR